VSYLSDFFNDLLLYGIRFLKITTAIFYNMQQFFDMNTKAWMGIKAFN
jgi:hypothetical protein